MLKKLENLLRNDYFVMRKIKLKHEISFFSRAAREGKNDIECLNFIIPSLRKFIFGTMGFNIKI